MYTSVWAKYLPAIRIVMKRARNGAQSLQLNAGDFERAGLKRKSGYPFEMGVRNGRLKNVIIDLPLAADFAQVLLSDKNAQELIQNDGFDFTLNSKYELSIRHTPVTDETGTEGTSA
jgi:hypothetical protein